MNVEYVIDANIAIAVLNSDDLFHKQAMKFCLIENKVNILNVTKAEALIYPEKVGKIKQSEEIFKSLEIQTIPILDDIAMQACMLRAQYGNRKFPMIDALVVACGVVRNFNVVTTDTKWPTIKEADIHLLGDISK